MNNQIIIPVPLTQMNPCRRLIAVIGLFEDIGLALRKSGGASIEFQEIVSELGDLTTSHRNIRSFAYESDAK